jgi:SSS family solute:Na+ symporter
MKTGFLAYFAGYVALVLGAGLVFSRKMRSLEDFFLAARDLPGGLIFLALTSSWFGATSLLVATDRAFSSGLSSFWIMGVPAVSTILLLALFVARPLRRFEIMSLPDLFELRYGRLVRHLAAILIILYMIMLAASQLVALGQFLKTFLGLSYLGSLAVGMAVVLTYSAVGGLRSVIFTDVIKFPLLVAGVGGLTVFLAGRRAGAGNPVVADGIGAAFAAAPAGTSGYFDIFRNAGENVLIAISFTLAWMISPIALQRIQAARSLTAARRGLFGAAAALFCLYALVVAIGVLAASLFAGKPLSGPLVSEIIAAHAGPVFGGVLFVAVLGAILSTMDTAVNTGALSLARDVFQQTSPLARLKPVLAGRVATIVVAVLAFAIAARLQNILKTIGLSSEIMAEGLFVPGMAMIFSRRRAPLAGLLSLALGGGFAVMSFLGAAGVLPLGLPVWPYSVPWGVGLSLAGYAAGSLIDWHRRIAA